jgi:hypothetical protein
MRVPEAINGILTRLPQSQTALSAVSWPGGSRGYHSTMSPFVGAVHRFFDSIIKPERMRPVVQEDNKVRYENESVFLDILFDAHRSYEISVVIGKLSTAETSGGRSFDLAEVLSMRTYPALPEISALRGPGQEPVATEVERLSRLTNQYAIRLLQHDEAYFPELATFRHWASLKYGWNTKKYESSAAHTVG